MLSRAVDEHQAPGVQQRQRLSDAPDELLQLALLFLVRRDFVESRRFQQHLAAEFGARQKVKGAAQGRGNQDQQGDGVDREITGLVVPPSRPCRHDRAGETQGREDRNQPRRRNEHFADNQRQAQDEQSDRQVGRFHRFQTVKKQWDKNIRQRHPTMGATRIAGFVRLPASFQFTDGLPPGNSRSRSSKGRAPSNRLAIQIR